MENGPQHSINSPSVPAFVESTSQGEREDNGGSEELCVSHCREQRTNAQEQSLKGIKKEQ